MPKKFYKTKYYTPRPVQRQRHYGNRTLFVQNRSFQLIPTDLFEQVCEPSLCEPIVSRPRNEGMAKATMWRAIQLRAWLRRQAAAELVEHFTHRNRVALIVRRLWRDKGLRAAFLQGVKQVKARRPSQGGRRRRGFCMQGHARPAKGKQCMICKREWMARNKASLNESRKRYYEKNKDTLNQNRRLKRKEARNGTTTDLRLGSNGCKVP